MGRKLRAALTAVAIVLGVAMISGTYVLTDTIKAAFGTVFTQVYKNTDAVITGKSAIGGNQNDNVTPPSLPESLLAKVRALPGVAAAEGGISDQAHLVSRQNKVISPHGAPNLAFSVDPRGDQRFNPLVLTSGRWPAAGSRSRSTTRPRRASTSHSVTRSACSRAGRKRSSASSASCASAGSPHRRRDARRLRPADRADDLRQAREARLDRDRRQAERRAGRARRTGETASAGDGAGAHGPGRGETGGEGHERLPEHPRVLPARVRVHRALRRQLRDREHALDHDRAAHARARDTAHARRDAPADLLVGDHRGVRDRALRVGRRALPRARARQAPQLPLRSVRDRPPAGRDRVRHAHDRRRADRRHARDGRRRSAAGVARDARRADRRRPRRARCCRAAGSLRSVPTSPSVSSSWRSA